MAKSKRRSRWRKRRLRSSFKNAVARIPLGVYCYKLLDTSMVITKGYIKTKLCPFWKRWRGEEMARCILIGVTDDFCLNDQCKICGINDPDEDLDFTIEDNTGKEV